jgi:hypothetical protein
MAKKPFFATLDAKTSRIRCKKKGHVKINCTKIWKILPIYLFEAKCQWREGNGGTEMTLTTFS